jgi:hypothetical protein
MSRLWTATEENPLVDRTVLMTVRPLWVDPLRRVIEDAGGHPLPVQSAEEAISFLRFNQPEFVILSEAFTESGALTDPFLEFIQNMPTIQRREIYVVWIGTNIKSGDLLTAFSYSVNLTVEPEQIPNLVELIKTSWSQWKGLYQVFVQTRLQITGP